jgi:hypothetical protein
MRIPPIRVNDHRRDVGPPKMTKKLPTHIAKTAHHDMTAHQRNPHLQHPITKQHSQATEPGVTGHDRCQETATSNGIGR